MEDTVQADVATMITISKNGALGPTISALIAGMGKAAPLEADNKAMEYRVYIPYHFAYLEDGSQQSCPFGIAVTQLPECIYYACRGELKDLSVRILIV
jgi:hypothetical protein